MLSFHRMERTSWNDEALSSLNVVVCTLHIEYHLSIYNLNKRIERCSVLRKSLSRVEAKKCNATSIVMNELFAYYATISVIYQFVALKIFPFSNFIISSLYFVVIINLQQTYNMYAILR